MVRKRLFWSALGHYWVKTFSEDLPDFEKRITYEFRHRFDAFVSRIQQDKDLPDAYLEIFKARALELQDLERLFEATLDERVRDFRMALRKVRAGEVDIITDKMAPVFIQASKEKGK